MPNAKIRKKFILHISKKQGIESTTNLNAEVATSDKFWRNIKDKPFLSFSISIQRDN